MILIDSRSKMEEENPLFNESKSYSAIWFSIIAIGVVVRGIIWGVKEFDKTSIEDAKRECIGYVITYYHYIENVKISEYAYSDYMEFSQRLLRKCLAKKGYSLGY